MKLFAATLSVLVGIAVTAQAHQIWLEQPDGQNAVIRYGEFGDNLREASPGLLDGFGRPAATLISPNGERKVDATKSASGFVLPFKASQGETIVAEDEVYPLRKIRQGDREFISWFRPSARYATSFAALEPKLVLDIVPAGQPGTFKLFFRGKPLPKSKVAVVVQSGWAKEALTDEQGAVNFDLPWSGSYVLEASHIERTPGERRGVNGPEPYAGIYHSTTLHVGKPDGIAPIPAGPASLPNK